MEKAPVARVWVVWPWSFPCRTSIGRGRRIRRLGRVGGQESAAGLVRTQLCRSECDVGQTSVANEVLRATSTKTAASQATAAQHVELWWDKPSRHLLRSPPKLRMEKRRFATEQTARADSAAAGRLIAQYNLPYGRSHCVLLRHLSGIWGLDCGETAFQNGRDPGEVSRHLPRARVREGICLRVERDSRVRFAVASFRAAALLPF
jgi:hypothetical protein